MSRGCRPSFERCSVCSLSLGSSLQISRDLFLRAVRNLIFCNSHGTHSALKASAYRYGYIDTSILLGRPILPNWRFSLMLAGKNASVRGHVIRLRSLGKWQTKDLSHPLHGRNMASERTGDF